jgi:hypothetical protein
VAVVAVAVVGCASGADEERSMFVLLTDNRLLRVSDEGKVLSRVRLGTAPEFASYGSLLALSSEGKTVYALVRGAQQQLVALDLDGEVVRTHALPADATWRRLAVGPKSGRIYLAGDVEGTRKNDLGAIELGVRLLVLSPDGEQLTLEHIRDPEGRDWYTGWITVSPDEESLLITYHGSDTTGSDLIRLDPIRVCVDRTPEWAACLATNHGRAQRAGDDILAATGEAQLALLTSSGRVTRKLDTGLRNIHLMEFAVAGDVAYAFGDCVKGAGLARVPLDGGTVRRLSRSVCGDVATPLAGSTLVLGRRWNRDPYGRGRSASLVFVDLAAGTISRSIELPEDPADVLAVG